MIFACLYALLSFMLCFHFCTHVCLHLISNVCIVRTFENIIPFQTFEKWYNLSYRYVSKVKSEASDIWKTVVWLLKPFSWRVDKNPIYHQAKPNSTLKTREGVIYVTKLIFWKIQRLILRAKFESLT